MQELLDLETAGWRALSTPGDAAREFYAGILREDAVMLFPGGLRIEGRRQILESFAARPWDSFLIEDAAIIRLAGDVATLLYRVTAQRSGNAPYAALVGSTYVRKHDWQLAIHQQTPA